MDLREYLFRERISVTDFSKSIHYSRGHISKIVNGERTINTKLAHTIEIATNGMVKAKDLMSGKTQEKVKIKSKDKNR